MSGRYGYKNHNETPVRLLISKGLWTLAIAPSFVSVLLQAASNAVVDRRPHVYTDRSV